MFLVVGLWILFYSYLNYVIIGVYLWYGLVVVWINGYVLVFLFGVFVFE